MWELTIHWREKPILDVPLLSYFSRISLGVMTNLDSDGFHVRRSGLGHLSASLGKAIVPKSWMYLSVGKHVENY